MARLKASFGQVFVQTGLHPFGIALIPTLNVVQSGFRYSGGLVLWITIDSRYVEEKFRKIKDDEDLSRFIL